VSVRGAPTNCFFRLTRLGFVAFDSIKHALADENGKLTSTSTIVAGFGAGVAESALAVTPFESIKTQLIDDKKRAQPRMRGFLHGSAVIAREKGLRGFFQGFVPTTARQAANSAVRFTSYNTIKRYAEDGLKPGEKLGSLTHFGMGGIAGIITVSVTLTNFHVILGADKP
jgi:solute carrier family 25 citrate transporter 1